MSNEYKTTDYCARCGESPESGTHVVLPHEAGGHDYVPPRYLTGRGKHSIVAICPYSGQPQPHVCTCGACS